VPAGFSDDAARAAFQAAIRAIESESAAEVVVSVRRQSAPWLHAHLIVGILVAIAADAYMLLSSTPFSTMSLLVDPIVAGGVVGLASALVLPVRRWLTPRRMRRRAVRAAARAAFVDRGIRRTRDATGILVYVSVVERMAEVVADDGVLAAISEGEWRPIADAIDAAVARGGVATARAVAALAPALGAALPRGTDDVNELPDELHVGEDPA
jgi:putative membrane protein